MDDSQIHTVIVRDDVPTIPNDGIKKSSTNPNLTSGIILGKKNSQKISVKDYAASSEIHLRISSDTNFVAGIIRPKSSDEVSFSSKLKLEKSRKF